MPGTVTIVGVTKNAPSGALMFRFADGSNKEYNNVDHAIEDCRIDLNPEVVKQIAIARYLAADPDASDLDLAVGTYTFDLSAVAPIVKT